MNRPDTAQGMDTRRLAWMLLSIGLLTTVVWLDSLERYTSARYHWNLETWVPDALVAPSRRLARWLGKGEAMDGESEASAPSASAASSATAAASAPTARVTTALSHPARVVPPVVATGNVEPLPPGEFLPSLHQLKLAPGPQRILFAGDSMMQGVAPLVIHDLAQRHPDWRFFDESRQSTGLTVKRYFDWPARIIEDMDQNRLTLVIVFLGPNDPWDIYEPGRRLLFPSAAWEERYAQRVDAILEEATRRGVQVVWLGLPSMRDGRVRDGAIVQNRVFHDRAQAFGTDYLSTEALVGPLSKPFRRFMDEPDQRPIPLRAEDGIHFTPGGLNRIRQALLEHLEPGSGAATQPFAAASAKTASAAGR